MSFKDGNISSDSQSYTDSGNMCLELALEGERLCRSGDCRAGVAFFLAALQAGTDDIKTLSAIYSQLGNAYFYLGDYHRAVQYHKHDLTLARTLGDKLGEAKSSGNLGNALKVMGNFNEAALCCERQLELSRELNNKLSEGRALYNLGNVYLAKGKHVGRIGQQQQDPKEYSEEVKNCLKQAVDYYTQNLELSRELGDVAAQGRACGNLGNTNYLLGNFNEAIMYHEQRLKIAQDFEDKAAERRAHSNLGNSYIFLNDYEKAAEHYKQMLRLAEEQNDKPIEGQACYSLGNTYTFLQDYSSAIKYYLRHYLIAQIVQDRVGEGRACWSLGNSYKALQDYEKALRFAEEHLIISKELSDAVQQSTAYMNVVELRNLLGISTSSWALNESNCIPKSNNTSQVSSTMVKKRVRRKSMEHLDLIKMSPDCRRENTLKENRPVSGMENARFMQIEDTVREDEDVFDLLSHAQSKRMDDQRCTLGVLKPKNSMRSKSCPISASVSVPKIESNKEPIPTCQNNDFNNIPTVTSAAAEDDVLDLIMDIQCKRLDEQRAELPNFPGLCRPSRRMRNRNLAKDQLPPPLETDLDEELQPNPRYERRSTVPDEEDLFAFIARIQSGRMDDQRVEMKRK